MNTLFRLINIFKILLLLLLITLLINGVPRPVKVAAIFDHDSDMRHDLMFVNAIKARTSEYSKIVKF